MILPADRPTIAALMLAQSVVLAAWLLLVGCVTEITGDAVRIASNSKRVHAQLEVARGYIRLADYQRARQAINKALAIDSRIAQAYGLHALVQEREGDFGMAAANFQKALKLDAEDSRLWNNYGTFLFAQKQYDQACAALERAAADPGYTGRAGAFNNLGLCRLQLGMAKLAERAFRRSLLLDEQQSTSWFGLAQIAYQGRDCQQAKTYYQRFVRFGIQTASSMELGRLILASCPGGEQP